MRKTKNYIEVLTQLGDYKELPDYIRDKIWITNLSIFIGITFSFMFICRALIINELGSVVFISLSVFVTFCFMLLSNIYGGIVYSRFFVIIIPVLANAVAIVITTSEVSNVNDTLLFGSLCYALFSFILIDFREKKFLLFSLLFCILIILITPILTTITSEESKIVLKDIESFEKVQMFINFFLIGVIITYLSRNYYIKEDVISVEREKIKNEIRQLRVSITKKEILVKEIFYHNNINQRHNNELKDIQQIRRIIIKHDIIEGLKTIIILLHDRVPFIKVAFHHAFINEFNTYNAILKILFYQKDEQEIINNKITHFNEGLVGQVLKNKKTIHIPNLPDIYAYEKNENMSNNLIVERHLYLCSILYNDIFYGVIEFTCQYKLSNNVLKYLDIVLKTAGQELFLNNKK